VTAVQLLADEDLRYAIVLATRRVDFQVRFDAVHDHALAGKTDDEVLDFAFKHGFLVVSHDANTMTAAARKRLANGQGMAGLLIVHQHTPTRKTAEDLALIAGASSAEEWVGRIVFLPL
jgi:hypothetical protein